MIRLFPYTAFMAAFLYMPAFAASPGPLDGLNTDAPVRIEADKLEVSRNDSVATFSGDVHATQGALTMTGASMRVFYSEAKGDGAVPGVKKIDIFGKVRVFSGKDTATGDHAVYDADAGTVTMKGKNLVLTSGKNTLKGKTLVYDINTGRSRLEGGSSRVTGVFIPGDK